jgi:tRNA(Ile)-lysidine synthase
VSELLTHVDQCIQARRLFRPGQRILVAVSGGVDSMVLLQVLRELAPKHRWRLTVAHFNHQLRGRSSDADERLVRRAAQQLKVPLVSGRAEVREFARTRKLSVEMAARELRHGFLAGTARRLRIPSVALAHHADDQLELFFLRLLRGSGGEGLTGMKWRAPSPAGVEIELVRPLLDQPKVVLAQYAAEQGIRFREDASNAVLDFQRNRIRHELLPLLRGNYQPALDRTIPRVMEIVGADAEFVAQAAREWLAQRGSPKAEARRSKERRSAKSGSVRASLRRAVLDREREHDRVPFDKLPVAVQRRCVQFQLVSLGIVADYELVEQLRIKADRLVALSRTQTADVGGTDETSVLRYAVRDRSGWLHLRAPRPTEFSSSSAEVELSGGAGEIEFDGTRMEWRVNARKGVGQPKARDREELFDADQVGLLVRLRHWRPGDRFQPIGMARPVKLQDFFTNQKVPREQRRRLIVATAATGEVFWVEGMRISERFKLTKQTIRRLQWRWKRL